MAVVTLALSLALTYAGLSLCFRRAIAPLSLRDWFLKLDDETIYRTLYRRR